MLSSKVRTNLSSVAPLTDERELPGKDGPKLYHLIDLIRNGQRYFSKRKERYKSSVFKVNMGVRGIAICDRRGIDVMFDVEKVRKEPAFGRLRYNLCLLDGHTPSIFANDAEHEKQKTFLMKLCKLAQEARVLSAAARVVPSYLKRWQNADPQLKLTWEMDVMAMTSDIFTEAFLGTRVKPTCMYNMVKGSWTSGSKLKRAMSAASELKETFRSCPNLSSLVSTATDAGLTEEQAIMDVLFMLNFNAYGGTCGAIQGCLARLHNLNRDMKQHMKNEVVSILNKEELTEEALGKMKLLDHFILEVIRLSPPVPILFGRARMDFVLQSDSGKFRVKEGELLVGNGYMVQRDPNVFDRPEEFIPSRFEDESLLHHIVVLNGPFREEATVKNHHCPGKEIVFTVLKIVLVYFLVCCDFKLTRIPIWTGKKLRRFGGPDSIMKLSYLKYSPQRPLLKEGEEGVQIMDVTEEEIPGSDTSLRNAGLIIAGLSAE